MTAICHKCGSAKRNATSVCPNCHAAPDSDENLLLANMLTERFLTLAQLAVASGRIRAGHSVDFPSGLKSTVAAHLHGSGPPPLPRRLRWNTKIDAKYFGALAVVVLFPIFHPWPSFQLASSKDTVEAYEAFTGRFPSSAFSMDADRRIRLLQEDGIWKSAVVSGKIGNLRHYADNYPDGKFIDEARKRITRITRIADERWPFVKATRSVAEIQDFLEKNPETSHVAAAKERIRFLHEDYDWLMEHDDLRSLRRFAVRFPEHPKIDSINRRIIDLEVVKISKHPSQSAPDLTTYSMGGTTVTHHIFNETPYTLTFRYSGPGSKATVVPAGGKRSVVLVPGAYRIVASVNSEKVRNYVKDQTLQAGVYGSIYVINDSFGPDIRLSPKE